MPSDVLPDPAEAPVTWSRMRSFLTVADHGSIRVAAAHLHVTEPAVSTAIAHVERQLGTDLLAKEGRGVVLTDAGRVFAGYCRTILGLLAESQAAVRAAAVGSVRIGAVGTASEYVVPRLLARFRDQHPDVGLTLTVLPRDDLFTGLAHHELDLVFAGRPPRGSGLVTRATRANRLIVVGRPDRFTDPLAAPWLLRGPGSGTRDTALALLNELDTNPVTLTLGTLGAVVAAAREGLGVTLVHEDAVGADIANGALAQLPVPRTPMNRPWHIATTPTPTAATRLFLRAVTDAGLVGTAAFHLQNRPSG